MPKFQFWLLSTNYFKFYKIGNRWDNGKHETESDILHDIAGGFKVFNVFCLFNFSDLLYAQEFYTLLDFISTLNLLTWQLN